jgi:aminoglycoside phosphotransferase (APT) family kinase protein
LAADLVSALSHDPAFPALRRATSTEYLLGLFRDSIGDVRQIQSIYVLNYRPGKRATLLYQMETAAGQTRALVGKWYSLRYQARDQVERLTWLESQATEAGLAFPRLAGADPPRAVVLQEYVGGTALRDLAFSDDERPFAKSGEWLARLHALKPSPLLKLKTHDREIEKATGWARMVATAMPHLERVAEDVAGNLKTLGRQLGGQPVVIHRDFYPANVVWDGERVWGLDFDQIALGNRSVDLGAFVAQTEKLCLQAGRPVEDLRHQTSAFLNAYEGAMGVKLEPSLSFFRAYTLLRLAATEVERGRSAGGSLATAFVERAKATLLP